MVLSGVAGYAGIRRRGREDELVERYAPLVKRIAHHLAGRLPPSVQVDDLIQSGLIGLLEAARNFEEGMGASFETFAGIRIRGAMLDEVRRHDWAPRSVHRKARQVAEAIRGVESREGREAQSQEIAESLGLSLDEYHELLQDASGHKLLSLDNAAVDDETFLDRLPDERVDVARGVLDDDFQEALAREIGRLPEREKLVMSLYYDDELNLKEIGAVLGVTESRVCQLHSQALARLRARLHT